MFLGRFHGGGIITLTVEVSADPAGSVPVDIFIGRIEFRAREVLRKPETAAPGAIAFLQRLVFAGDALGTNRSDGRRPHGLDDDFARGHEVDAFVEALPEGAELAVLLGLDEEVDGLVDLLLGHVALVGIFDVAHGFHDHRRIHDADGGNVEDRGLALELRVHDIGPAGDIAADEIGADAERIGVVDGRNHGEIIGLALGELLVAGLFDETDRVRGRALRHDAVRLQLAVFEQRHDLVVIFQLLDFHRLDDAGRIDLLQDPVFDIGDIVGIRLGDGALGGGIRIRRRHFERDAEIGLALFGNGVEVRHTGAELADGDRVLRPDGREAGDKAGADRRTRGGSARLQEAAAGQALFAVAGIGHFKVLLWLFLGSLLYPAEHDGIGRIP